jgi:hypothetical protein
MPISVMATYDAIICRQRAERIRVTAERMTNQESRDTMFRLAENYDRMADTIERMVGVSPMERKA